MTFDIRKNFIYTRDISSETADLARKYFKDFVSTDVRTEGLVYTFNFSSPQPNELIGAGILRQENRKISEEIKNSTGVGPQRIGLKKYIYHNFSYFTPSDKKTSEYTFSFENFSNSQLSTQYEEKIQSLNTATENEIKNVYDIKNGEIQNYYKGAIRRQENSSEAAWDIYRSFFFDETTLTDQEKNAEIRSDVPFYNYLNIPSIQGFSREFLTSFYNIFNLLKTKDLTLDVETITPILLSFLYSAKNNVDLIINESLETGFPVITTNAFINSFNTYEANLQKATNLNVNLDGDYLIPNISRTAFFEQFFDLLPKEKRINILKNKLETPTIPIFYKIKKYKVGQRGELQTFFVPYAVGNEINLFDNQIFVSGEYQYEISLLVVSVGIAYSYSILEETPNRIIFTVDDSDTDVNFGLFEIPYIARNPVQRNAILPVIPEATIVGLFNDPNQIKIFLNTKPAVELPIALTTNEEAILNTLTDGLTKEKKFTNSNFKYFYSYRLESQPISYTSFAEAKISAPLERTKDGFYDYLESNKKYYYMFRTSDGRFFSNPSEIYEVEIKNDNGKITPTINEYYPSSNNKKFDGRESESVRRRFTISPSFYQLNVSGSGDKLNKNSYADLQLGDLYFDLSKFQGVQSIFSPEEVVGAPRYKVRVISKKTGKMVDINLKFEYAFRNNIKKNI
jgi:hypothetical protein